MRPKVLLATSLGPGKEYTQELLLSTVRAMKGISHVLCTLDEFRWEGPREWILQHLYKPPKPISIHGRLARMREAQRRLFLSVPWTHLYWHDSDMVPPLDIIPRLLAHDAPVASGLYNRRGDQDLCLCVFKRFGRLPGEELGDTVIEEIEVVDGLARMAGAGTGCMLVKREVLQDFPFRDPEWYPAEGPGEDVRWCMDLDEAGIPVLVDWNLPCWHVSEDGTGTRPVLRT